MSEILAIIGAIAACDQIISRLTKVIKALAMAGKEQDSMVLRLNHQIILLQGFSELLTDFGPDITPDGRHHFQVVIKHMEIVLENTLMKMEKVSKRKSSKYLWVIAGKDLKDSERELFEWSQRLMIGFAFMSTPLKSNLIEKFADMKNAKSPPSWILGLMANMRMEQGRDSVPIASVDQTTSTALVQPIPWNSLHSERLEQLWVDQIQTHTSPFAGEMTMDQIQIEVGRLFAVLKQADSVSNRILSANHFLITDDPQHRFAIASSLPSDTCRTQLLSEMLVEPSQHPLDHRIRAAREFVTAIAYVHAVGWVHKAVRPSNILMLHAHDDVVYPQGLGHAFLVGFEYARRGTARSTGSGHWDWKDDIYRHPDRQYKDGVDLETYFTVKHDIYSAGVVLLELGAWTSLARDCPGLKLADPGERWKLLLDYSDAISGAVGSRYAALAKKCIAVDASGIDVQQLLTELQELRI